MVANVLLRKLRRDLWDTRWQMLGILLISALGVFAFSGLDASWRDMDLTTNRYYDEQRFADLWVIQEEFTPDDVASLRSTDGVAEVASRTTVEATVDLPHHPTLALHIARETPTVNVPRIVEEDASVAPDNAVYLEKEFADANGLRPGDTITLNVDGLSQTLTIRALVHSPEYLLTTKLSVISDHENYGFAWIYPTTGLLRQVPVTELNLRVSPGTSVDDVAERIQDRFPNAFILDRDLNAGHAYFLSDIVAFRNLTLMLPVLFIGVAALVIMSTMKRLVDTQRSHIGILNSLGYPDRRIIAHYLAYGLVPTAIGSAIGILIARAYLPQAIWSVEQETYVIPDRVAAPISLNVMLVAIGMLVMAVAISYLALRELLRQRPADLLRPPAPRLGSTTLLERWGSLWRRLGFNTKMVIRNLGRQRGRTIMGFAGVLVCTSLIAASLGMLTSLTATINSYYDSRLTYDVYVTLVPDAAISDDDLAAIPADRIDAAQDTPIEISSDSHTMTTSLLVMDPDQASLAIGELPADGLVLPEIYAEDLNVAAGDTVRVHAIGGSSSYDLRVARLVDIPIALGLYSSTTYWDATTGQPFAPTNLMIDGDGDAVIAQLAETDEVVSWESLPKQKADMLDMIGTMMSVISIIIVVALMLAFVVLHTMGTLNFIERVREFATLKVLGYHQSEIRRLIVTENLLVTTVAALLGIPLGWVITGWIMRTSVPTNMSIATVFTWWAVLLAVGLTIGFSWLVQIWIARSVRGIDMVSALKSVE